MASSRRLQSSTASEPRVSITPFYNCAYLGEAIQSTLDQTYRNIEVSVVDDDSTKRMEKVEPFKDRMRYLRKVNSGTDSTLNEGIRPPSGSSPHHLPESIRVSQPNTQPEWEKCELANGRLLEKS